MSYVLVLNSGSSSIKFAVFSADGAERAKLLEGSIEGIGKSGKFWLKSWLKASIDSGTGDHNGEKIVDETPDLPDLQAAFALITQTLGQPGYPQPDAIGHRMVCGGPTVTENQRITPALLDEMAKYTSFAPLHAPSELFLMREAIKLYPEVPNFVCLDSRFHRDLPEVTRHLPIPEEYTQLGLRRFGAHGLSYESIVEHLKPDVPARLIVAHLGNGASVCAIRDGQSVDTSMGLTPTGGILSGSRTGDLDPGILLFLLRHLAEKEDNANKAADQLEKIVNNHSGLLGVSQLDSDMRALRKAIGEGNQHARLAVTEFTYVLKKFIAGYIAVLGGLDLLVFTGGIGENDPETRAETCHGLDSFGIELDSALNAKAKGESTISTPQSKVKIQVIPAAEDLMIVNHVTRLLEQDSA